MRQCNAWIIWFVATLFVVYTFTLGTAASVFSTSVQQSLHLTSEQVSFSFGLFILGFACMQLPAGYLLDRFNTRYVLSAAILLMLLGNWIVSIAHESTLFAVANFLEGMGGSFDFISVSILVASWFPPKMFPILTGLTQTVACFAVALLHYFLTIDLQAHSWQLIYHYFFIAGLALFILTFLVVRTPPSFHLNYKLSFHAALICVLRKKQNWLCALGAASSFGLLLSYASFWYAEIQKNYHVPVADTAIIGGCVFVGIGIGTPILGWLSNIVRSRKLVIHISLSLGIMALMLSLYLPHFNIQSYWIAKAVAFFIGFFLSGGLLYYTIVSESTDNETRGLALSLTNTASFLSNVFMLMIPYLFITSQSNIYFTYLWVYPVCAISSLLFNYFVKDTGS